MLEISPVKIANNADKRRTQLGSSFKAVYHKPANQPQLVAKQTPSGTHEFRARAWWEACQRARSMGWIV